MRILIIEDNKAILCHLRAGFEAECFKVDTALSGDKGLELAKLNKYDLIILDIKMPGQDGLEVLREIKDTVELSNVIVLSGWSDKQVMLKAFNLGIFAYISKSEPDIYEILQEKIESILISKGKLLKNNSS